MTVMDTKKVIYLLTENCKSRLSCSGCDMTGKHSMKDTCLLLALKESLKQSALPITVDMKQLPASVVRVWSIEETLSKTMLVADGEPPLVKIGE
jgi:hypothetical protein